MSGKGKGYTRLKTGRKTKAKLPAAVILGHRGGRVGGPARAKVLTPKERSAIARMGGKARHRGV